MSERTTASTARSPVTQPPSDGLLKKLMWAGDTDALHRIARCICCCDEHTAEGCPARRWHGCLGQQALTSAEVEAWFRSYERVRGFTRAQFFGEAEARSVEVTAMVDEPEDR